MLRWWREMAAVKLEKVPVTQPVRNIKFYALFWNGGGHCALQPIWIIHQKWHYNDLAATYRERYKFSSLLLWQTISDSADWIVWCKAQIMVGRHNWWYIDERIHNYCRNAVLAVASIAIVKQHVLIFTKKGNIYWNRLYVHLFSHSRSWLL